MLFCNFFLFCTHFLFHCGLLVAMNVKFFCFIRNRAANAGLSTLSLKTLACLKTKSENLFIIINYKFSLLKDVQYIMYHYNILFTLNRIYEFLFFSVHSEKVHNFAKVEARIKFGGIK
jgi:hypothetical protein